MEWVGKDNNPSIRTPNRAISLQMPFVWEGLQSCASTQLLLQPLPLLPNLAEPLSAAFQGDAAKAASIPFIACWLAEHCPGTSPNAQICPATMVPGFLLSAYPWCLCLVIVCATEF